MCLCFDKRDCFAPLHLAVSNGQVDIVKLLISHGADVNTSDGNGQTPLQLAASSIMIDVLNVQGLEIDAVNNNGDTALISACKNGDCVIVNKLLCVGAHVNGITGSCTTPLCAACCYIYGYDVVEMLLEHGADVNTRDVNGRTPLFVACSNGHDDTVNSLIKHGAVLDENVQYGALKNHHVSTVYILIQAGAKINVKDSAGDSLLHTFCCRDADPVAV